MADLPRQLLQLVKTQKFAAADRLRMVMSTSRAIIPPDRVYEKAARNAVLSGSSGDNTRKLEDFSFWFSLVPAKHEANNAESFAGLKQAIFNTGTPSNNIPLAMRFAMICASKGYAREALSESVYLVQRFAKSMAGAQFLYEFEKEAVGYADRLLAQNPKDRTIELQRLRGIAVRACVEADWLLEAVDLVVAFRSSGNEVPDHTIRFLVEKLHGAGRSNLVSTVLQGREEG